MDDEREQIACYFCGAGASEVQPVEQPLMHYVECPGCTRYSITDDVFLEIDARPPTSSERAKLSGWTREHPRAVFNIKEYDEVRALPMPGPLDKAGKLFDHLAVVCSKSGEWYELEFGSPALRSAAWAESPRELEYLLSQVLGEQWGLLEIHPHVKHEQFLQARITPRGWSAIEERKHLPPPQRPIGFTS